MSASRGPAIVAVLGAASLVVAAVALFRSSDPSAPALTKAASDPAAPLASSAEGRAIVPVQGVTPKKAVDPATPPPSSDPAIVRESALSPSPVPLVPVAEAKPRYQPGPSKFKNAKRPEARTALARVGSDFEAEALWLQSINDPGVPANERKDLIEDLNEDGISDPAKPKREDLILINNRIQLIDRLLPFAVDKVNAEAFKEARKDLVNMRTRLEE